MTQKQAEIELERLRKEWCKCGSEALKVVKHPAGCPYRIAAISNAQLRPFAGQLYSIAV